MYMFVYSFICLFVYVFFIYIDRCNVAKHFNFSASIDSTP